MMGEKKSRDPSVAQAFSDSETKLKTRKRKTTTKKKNPATMSFPTKFAGK